MHFRFFNNMNMRRKMLFIYLAAILIPFVTASLLYTVYVQATVERQSLETVKSRILVCSQNVNSHLQSYVMLTNLIADNREFAGRLESRYLSVLDALALYQEIWLQYAANLQAWPRIRNITIYSKNPTLLNSYPYLIRTDAYFEALPQYDEIILSGFAGAWYASRGSGGREYWNPANDTSSIRRTRSFTYNRVIYSADLTALPIGIITMEIDTDTLGEFVKTEDNLELFIFDRQKTLLAASGGEWQSAYAPVFDLAEEGGAVPLESGGLSYYGDSCKLENGWWLVAVMPKKDALAPAKAILDAGILLIVAASCAIVALIIVLSGQIAKRSGKLLAKMTAFMGDEMVLGESLGGKDEIGLLDEGFSRLAGELKRRIEESYVLELQKNKYHLEILQSQINPHFLYNTLSAIAWMSDTEPREKIRAAVESLASFYRVTLSGGKDIISLGEELRGLGEYISLQNIRHGGRIKVYYDLDDLTQKTSIPKLSLQPLVENCVCHGLGGEKSSISIMVSAHVTGGLVEIRVQDDGPGFSPEALQRLKAGKISGGEGNGLGLQNIHERIKLYFGTDYGLEIQQGGSCGALVTIRIPFTENDK